MSQIVLQSSKKFTNNDIYFMEVVEEKIIINDNYDGVLILDSDLNIGSFYYELNNNSVFSDVTEKSVYSKKYDIKKIPFDKLIVMSGCKCTSGLISTDSCFEKISLESLFNDDRFRKSSKKRILKNDRRGNR